MSTYPLPRHSANGANGANGAHAVLEPRHPWILLCDDDARDLATMTDLLKRHGFRVHAASSVAESAQVLSRRLVSAVVADLRLGHGKPDGAELLVLAKNAQPDAHRVLVTAATEGPDLAKIADAIWVNKAEPRITLVRVLEAALR